MTLSLKQRKFIDAYLGPASGNATAAARLAGYALPRQQGYENLIKPYISAEIARRTEALAMSAAEVLARLSDHARGSMAPFLRFDESGRMRVDLTTEEARANLHLIRKIKTRERSGGKGDKAWTEFEVEVELHDAQAALVLLGRHHKLFTDRRECAAQVEGVVSYEVVIPSASRPASLTDRQRGETVCALLESTSIGRADREERFCLN